MKSITFESSLYTSKYTKIQPNKMQNGKERMPRKKMLQRRTDSSKTMQQKSDTQSKWLFPNGEQWDEREGQTGFGGL